jgi:serine/threonine-protein kinase
MSCPDANVLEQYLGAKLSPTEAAEIESHVDSCPECRKLVAALSRSSASQPPGGEVLENTVPPSTPPPPIASALEPEMEMPARLGDVIAGKYRIDRVVGAGGMGVVVSARHLQLNQSVALKFMRPALARDGQAVARFLREARAAAALRSEHVARILDIATTEGGQPFIVMEYLEGEDLAALLKRTGPLPLSEAVGLVLQALETVGEAHALGIIHRDLKPGNLFVTRRVDGTPSIKVLDFGLSKISRGATASSDFTATTSKSMMGSPLYMAPEQLMAQPTVGPRSDIYAVGCILFELLSGRTPFRGESLPELIAQVLHGELRSLCSLRPEVPAPLEAVILKCLERDVTRRVASVAELVEALAPFAPAGAGAAATASRISSAPASVPGPRRKRAIWAAVAVLGIAFGIAVAVLASSGSHKPVDMAPLNEAMAKESSSPPDATGPVMSDPATAAVVVEEKPAALPVPAPVHKPVPAKKPKPRSEVFDSRQ